MSTKLKAGTATSGAVIDADTAGTLEIQTGSTPTTAISIDASQNVGVGTATLGSSGKFQVGGGRSYFGSNNSVYAINVSYNNTRALAGQGYYLGATDSATPDLIFSEQGGVERMRIDASGNLLVQATNSGLSVGVGIKLLTNPTVPAIGITTDTAVGTAGTYHLYNVNATNNGFRFYVTTNGGIYNYSGNNSNLSDERTKKNIEISGNYLEKICSIPVKLFNYKDEVDGEQKTLGVIAQDVEAIAPEFVNNDGWEGTEPKDGVPLKTIYSTDMMFGMMKAIQEQQTMIEELKTKVAALEAK
jgi:hypothetical protein